jgi:ribonuclease HI
MSPTIFIDGGARPNPGPAAAAIVLRSLGDGGLLASKAHARYYPLATNNITEAIAMTAALRKAHRLLQNSTHQHINIGMDSELVYKCVTGLKKCRDKKVAPIIDEAISLFIPIAGKLTLHVMRREHGNHADSVFTTAISAAPNLDDDDLFMDPP